MPDLEIKSIIDEAPNVKTFVFEKPSDFTHAPGQFCWISLPDHPKLGKSPMAIASGTKESLLKFSIRAWGDLTKKLFELDVGDVVTISSPEGTWFPTEMTEGRPLYGIAGGTGITPVRSLRYSIDLKNSEMQIFYGVRTPHDFLYKKELSQWNARLIVEKPDASWTSDVGLVTDLLNKDVLDVERGLCHVCGPRPMMVNVVKVLKDLGFAPDRIYVSLERMEKGKVIGPVFPVSNSIVGF